jgi:hypothetical protein
MAIKLLVDEVFLRTLLHPLDLTLVMTARIFGTPPASRRTESTPVCMRADFRLL